MSLLLLGGGFLCLSGMAAGALLTVREQDRGRRLQRRFRTALEPHERVRDLAREPVRLAAPVSAPSASGRLGRIFGFDPARPELYSTKPPMIVAGALVAALVASRVLGLVAGGLAWAAVPVAWVMFGRLAFRIVHRRRSATLFRQFPDALAMIVRAVRVGIPVVEAVRVVARENEAPTATEFARLADQIAIGLPFDDALRGMAERVGLPEYRFFATALSLQSQTGGNLSETLENLADVIRKRVAARARAYALAAEARMSANVLTALPILLFGVLSFINPHYAGQLTGSGTGEMILGATLFLLGGGVAVMRLLIHKSLS